MLSFFARWMRRFPRASETTFGESATKRIASPSRASIFSLTARTSSAVRNLKMGEVQPSGMTLAQASPPAPYWATKSLSSSRSFLDSGSRLDADRLDHAPAAAISAKSLKPDFRDRREVPDLKAETHVRAVLSETAHGVAVGNAREGQGKLPAKAGPEQVGDHPFHDPDDVLLGDKGHLHVDLGELGLAVRPEVLVAEALDDLEVAVETRHLQELLEDLRRLGQGVEHPLVDAARDKVVPGAFGGALRQEGGFHLDEALPVEVLARCRGDPAPEDQVLLDIRTPEVEIAVLEPDVLRDFRRPVQDEGGRFRLVEDLELHGHHFDLSGPDLGVHHPFGPEAHRSPHGQDILGPDLARLLVAGGVELRVEDHLDEPSRSRRSTKITPP